MHRARREPSRRSRQPVVGSRLERQFVQARQYMVEVERSELHRRNRTAQHRGKQVGRSAPTVAVVVMVVAVAGKTLVVRAQTGQMPDAVVA